MHVMADLMRFIEYQCQVCGDILYVKKFAL